MGITAEEAAAEAMRPRNTDKATAAAVHRGRRIRLRLRKGGATPPEATDSLHQHPDMEIIRYVCSLVRLHRD